MEIRFGFVAMSMFLENASPSKTVTLKNYSALAEKDPEAALNKVRRATRENLANTIRRRVSLYFSLAILTPSRRKAAGRRRLSRRWPCGCPD